MINSFAVRQFVSIVRGEYPKELPPVKHQIAAMDSERRLCLRCSIVADHDVIHFQTTKVVWLVCRVCRQLYVNGELSDCCLEDNGTIQRILTKKGE